MKVQPSMKDCRSVRTPGIYLWGVIRVTQREALARAVETLTFQERTDKTRVVSKRRKLKADEKTMKLPSLKQLKVIKSFSKDGCPDCSGVNLHINIKETGIGQAQRIQCHDCSFVLDISEYEKW